MYWDDVVVGMSVIIVSSDTGEHVPDSVDARPLAGRITAKYATGDVEVELTNGITRIYTAKQLQARGRPG